MILRITALFFALAALSTPAAAWGFFAHRLINKQAIFSLPPELVGFYKAHVNYIMENAVNPDRRRYAVEHEAPRHFIDIDHYGDSSLIEMPKYWSEAVQRYSEDTLLEYGTVPWHISLTKFQLTRAFAEKDLNRILRLSADLGHYVADANVPLHTTENYNGQLTDQWGIHGLWESRLPELFHDQYDLFVGQSGYIENPQLEAWEAVRNAHNALDSVLRIERDLTGKFPIEKKYSFEERGRTIVKVYSRSFSEKYHRMMYGMVERRLRATIKMVADFWYTCWVDAGQPDLSQVQKVLSEEDRDELNREKKTWLKIRFKSRAHEFKEN